MMNEQRDIWDTFNKAFRGRRNMLTPKVLRYGRRGVFYYEVSEGDGFLKGRKLFGVTVLRINGQEPKPNLTRSFNSLQAAESYIENYFRE